MTTANKNKIIGDWGAELGRSVLVPFFPRVFLSNNPNEKDIDSFNPLAQFKARSFLQYGGKNSQKWSPTREKIVKAIRTRGDYLLLLLFHDGPSPFDEKHELKLKYGAIFTAKEAVADNVKWSWTKKKGAPTEKIDLVFMHDEPAQWPKVLFFNDQAKFKEKFPEWRKKNFP